MRRGRENRDIVYYMNYQEVLCVLRVLCGKTYDSTLKEALRSFFMKIGVKHREKVHKNVYNKE